MTALVDILGERFGRLVAVRRPTNARAQWECVCDCGQTKLVRGGSLRRGLTRSCGCLHNEELSARTITHGEARKEEKSPEYRAWRGMKQRCSSNPDGKDYKHYAGRGIRVCDRWLNNYENFLADVGRKPSLKHSLDRYPDNDGNYEPGNVRWATASQQASNTRRSRRAA